MEWIYSMQKAINMIEENLLNDINPDEVAKNVYFSSYHFNRIFNMITGVSIREYIQTYMEKCDGTVTVGFDGRCMTAGMQEETGLPNGVKVICDMDLVGDIWPDRPALSCRKIWRLDEVYAGKTTADCRPYTQYLL